MGDDEGNGLGTGLEIGMGGYGGPIGLNGADGEGWGDCYACEGTGDGQDNADGNSTIAPRRDEYTCGDYD